MDIQEVIHNKNVQIGGVGIGCLAVGAAAGFFFAKNKYQAEEFIFIEEEVMTLPFDDEESPSEHLVHSLDETYVSDKVQKIEHIGASDQQEEPVKNIFTREDNWNYDEEISQRSSDKPYVIHRDEFFADEMGLNQLTFTYYAGDDILTDEQDKPVHNYETVVGDIRFGHGSLDQNVFYVRNEELGAEYEILHTDGFYSIEVLGYGLESEYEEQDEKEILLKFKDE